MALIANKKNEIHKMENERQIERTFPYMANSMACLVNWVSLEQPSFDGVPVRSAIHTKMLCRAQDFMRTRQS